MDVLIENLIKLGMAVLAGGSIGAEREFQDKDGNTIHITWRPIGSPADHERLVGMMLKSRDIKELVY